MKQVLSALVIGTVATLGAASVQAHQIWFEQGKDRTVTLYYGEYDKNMLEVTPGGMDRFKALSGQWVTANGTQPLPMTLQRASFSVGDKPGKGDSLLAVDKKYPFFKVKDDQRLSCAFPATRSRHCADRCSQRRCRSIPSLLHERSADKQASDPVIGIRMGQLGHDRRRRKGVVRAAVEGDLCSRNRVSRPDPGRAREHG